MNNYNNGYGYPAGGYYGGAFYQPAPDLHMTQGLSQEQIKSLRKTGGFNLEVTNEELLKAYCTHRDATRFTTVTDDEGNVTCTMCGTTFKPFEGSVLEARELTKKFLGLIETTKMQAINLPTKVIQDFFQMEPLVERVPDLYSQSLNDYKKALGTDQYMMAQENNAFAMYQNILNPMAGNGYYDPAAAQPFYGAPQPMAQQPMMGYQQQPVYGQQPMMQQPQMGYNPQQVAQPQGNPFNIGSNPVVAPQPAVNPADTAAPVQPETVTVTANMKD